MTSRLRVVAAGLVAVGAVAIRPGTAFGLLLGGILFVPLERHLPIRRGWRTDVVHFLASGVLGTALSYLVAVALVITPVVLIRRSTLGWWVSLPTPLTVTIVLVVGFVGGYWGHRMMHAHPWLWRIHAVHHSSTRLDWLAAARLHPLDTALTSAPAIAVLFALGAGPGEIGGFAVVITVLAVFQHADVRWRLRPVRWVLPTPLWHHWHHADDPRSVDRNFGLPVLDLVFGTAFVADDFPERYGTSTPVPAEGYLAQLGSPFRAPVPVDLGASDA